MKYISILALVVYSSHSIAEKIVTDFHTGTTISLQYIDGYTLITNLDTGEQTIEKGNHEKMMSDIQYSKLMAEKRYKSSLNKIGITSNLSGEQNVEFHVTYPSGNEWESPDFYMNGTTVEATVDYMSGSRKDASLTLMRVRDYWLDANEGTKYYYDYDNLVHRWTNLPTSHNYYYEVRLKKESNTTPTSGFIRTTWE